MNTNVKLEIFEGPLDLLLHLIRKNEVDIYDIPVALITRQYLDYLELMEEINISLAGEFMVMAATLIQIKTKMMLPLQVEEDTEESEDPRMDLLARLKEHARMKNAVDFLETRPRLGRDIFAREGAARELAGTKAREEIIKVGVFELVSAFQRMLRRKQRQLSLSLMPITRISLEEKMSGLLERLRQENSLTFNQCFSDDRSKDDLIVTFLALLELTKQGMVNLYQERRAADENSPGQWGIIRVHFVPLQSGADGDNLLS